MEDVTAAKLAPIWVPLGTNKVRAHTCDDGPACQLKSPQFLRPAPDVELENNLDTFQLSCSLELQLSCSLEPRVPRIGRHPVLIAAAPAVLHVVVFGIMASNATP